MGGRVENFGWGWKIGDESARLGMGVYTSGVRIGEGFRALPKAFSYEEKVSAVG